MQVIQVQSLQEFQSSVLSEKRVCYVVFVADWCPPSLQMIQLLKKELELQRKRMTQQVAIVDIFVVDHDKEGTAQIIRTFCPTVMPYVYLFEKGKYIAQFGGMDISALGKIVTKGLEAARGL